MICVQHGFGSLISELSDLEEALGNYCRDAVRKLRKQNLATGNIVILLATHPFRQDLPQYRNSISIKLETEVFDILTITKKAMEGLKRIYKEGYGYKRVGILLTELKKDSMIQTNLFEEVDLNRAKALQKAYESINTTFGKEVIRVCMAKGEKKFKLKRELLSPCYTTRWEGVIEVH